MKLQLGMTPSEKTNNVPTQSYEITPAREDRPLLKPKTEDDYGLDDAHSDDSSDEETCPKKEIPRWALRGPATPTVFLCSKLDLSVRLGGACLAHVNVSLRKPLRVHTTHLPNMSKTNLTTSSVALVSGKTGSGMGSALPFCSLEKNREAGTTITVLFY
ncbi:hypothetical protein J6590_001257 [Homalodisca vitripennis]|nr:hypothetical protein J6590_001257 [Homalodisca vitripennis]